MAWQPHTPAAQQLAAIKSQTTTHLAYHVDDSPNAHHHIANGLGEVAYGRQLHNCQEAVAHSYWRALAPDPQAAASAYARKRPGERHKFIQGRYFEEEEDVEFNCTTPLQPVSLTGNYELTEAQIHPVQQQWADKQSAEGAVRAMDWLSLEAEILELDADDGSWEVLSSSRCVAHHNFIIDQVHSNLWSSTVAEHVNDGPLTHATLSDAGGWVVGTIRRYLREPAVISRFAELQKEAGRRPVAAVRWRLDVFHPRAGKFTWPNGTPFSPSAVARLG